MRLHELNDVLAEHGLALADLGDIDGQTVGGAIATGTHGTGARVGGLASFVAGLTLVDGRGEVVRADAGSDLLAAAAVSMGALGVVSEVTLRCVPAFVLHADERAIRLDDVLDGFDELMAGNDHAEFHWFPDTRVALTKRNNRVPDRRRAAAGLARLAGRRAAGEHGVRRDVPDGPGRATAGAGDEPIRRSRAGRPPLHGPLGPGVLLAAPGAVRRDGVRRCRGRRSTRRSASSAGSSRGCRSRSSSRSRCGSLPPTTAGCRPRTGGTPSTSPCTSTSACRTGRTSPRWRRSARRWAAARTGASCTAARRSRCAAGYRGLRGSVRCATSSTRSAGSRNGYLRRVIGA